MATPPRVAVVGGGVAGIAVAKECSAAGLEVVGFETCKELGGLWNPVRASAVFLYSPHLSLDPLISLLGKLLSGVALIGSLSFE